MRNTTGWRAELVAQLKAAAETYGPPALDAPSILDTELVLTILADHLPEEDPELAWAVLNGQPFPSKQSLSEEVQRAIAIARLRLPRLLSRDAWTNVMLPGYKRLASPYPLYRIDGTQITRTNTPLVPERLAIIRQALQTPVPLRERRPRFAPGGVYRFQLDGSFHEVEIPALLADQSLGYEGAELPVHGPYRLPITIRLEDLQSTAAWMDAIATPGGPVAERSWEEWIRDVMDLLAVTSSGLEPLSSLTLDGLLHLVGIVGVGKTTLYSILTVHLVRLGYKVGIVHGEVATIMSDLHLYSELGRADSRIRPLPLIGRRNRLQHRMRLYAAETWEHGPQLLSDHIGHRALSTICLLDGLRADAAPIPIGKEPCTALYPRSDNAEQRSSDEAFDCPLMPICPTHAVSLGIQDATIFLATPASMLTSSPQQPLLRTPMRYVELMIRSLDVLLIDEADRVQIQFDQQFAQIEVLVGGPSALLDTTGRQVAHHAYQPGRPLAGRAAQRWMTAHGNIQRAVDRIYYWLRERGELGVWLTQLGYFNGERLLKHLGHDLVRQGWESMDTLSYRQRVEQFCVNPLHIDFMSEAPLDAWGMAVQVELMTADAGRTHDVLRRWLMSLSPGATVTQLVLDKYATRLCVALLVAVVDTALRALINEWPSVEEMIELGRGSGSLFFPPADSLTRLIPEPPMGAALGLQYYDPQESGRGELRFFRVLGQGRWLLYHLHDALSLTDGIAGPHVVLTSGTSVASSVDIQQLDVDGRGTSWLYDLHVQPHLLLRPKVKPTPPEDRPRIRCFFTPIGDPNQAGKALTVSGTTPATRIYAMRTMITELARKRGFGKKSLFDMHFAEVPEERRRALMCVGRYEEALQVAETLNAALGGSPGEHAVAMVRDQIGDELIVELRPGTIVRSRVEDVVKLPITFLVAPLLGIERGFNFVLPNGLAAFGLVYFLARPLPIPGDPATAMHRVHAWSQRRVPRIESPLITRAGQLLRNEGDDRWRDELNRRETYTGSVRRTDLLWTEVVTVCQTIGRLLRGGATADVYFVDGRWADVSSGRSPSSIRESEETSILLGFRRILNDAVSDPNPAVRCVAEALYGDFLEGFRHIEGVPDDQP